MAMQAEPQAFRTLFQLILHVVFNVLWISLALSIGTTNLLLATRRNINVSVYSHMLDITQGRRERERERERQNACVRVMYCIQGVAQRNRSPQEEAEEDAETAAAEQHQASGTCCAIVLSIWFLRKTQASKSTNMDFVRSPPSSEAKRTNCQSTATISGRLLSQVKCDIYIYITYSCYVCSQFTTGRCRENQHNI